MRARLVPPGLMAARAALVVGGLLLGAAVAEGSLRLAGASYWWWRLGAARSAADGAVRVLCIGDSFTFGVGSSAGRSYPEQLKAILQRRLKQPVDVVNDGVPSYNSSQVLRRLPHALARARPCVVVALVGLNNAWNTTYGPSGLPGESRLEGWRRWLESFRLVRLVRQARVDPQVMYPDEYLRLDAQGDDNEQGGPADVQWVRRGQIALGQRRFEEAAKAFTQARAANPANADALVGFAAVLMMRGDVITRDAEQMLQEALRINPRSWAAHLILAASFVRQGRQEDAWREFQAASALNQGFVRSLMPLAAGRDPAAALDYLDRWLTQDVQAMAGQARAAGAAFVLMTYPASLRTQPFSDLLRRMAAREALPFIDLDEAFRALPGDRRSTLIAGDGFHTNADGNALVADTVGKALAPMLAAEKGTFR